MLTQQRFLIFPWIDVPHLASHVLSLSEAQLLTDWVAIYGYRPVLLETFVDSSRYAGTSYQAANWKKIGQTQGKPRPTAARGALRTNKEPPTTGPKTSMYAR